MFCFSKNDYLCIRFSDKERQKSILDVAQLVAHLVRDQEVEGSSPFIQTTVQRQPMVAAVLLFWGDMSIVCFRPAPLPHRTRFRTIHQMPTAAAVPHANAREAVTLYNAGNLSLRAEAERTNAQNGIAATTSGLYSRAPFRLRWSN